MIINQGLPTEDIITEGVGMDVDTVNCDFLEVTEATQQKHNPKYIQALKDGKTPFEMLVWEVLEDEAWVLKHGADKYGHRNWLEDMILASTYVGAISRHLAAITMGEWLDPESGRPHLAHIRACCTVWQHAKQHDMCIDDLSMTESKASGGGYG